MENRKINSDVKKMFKSNGALLQEIADKRQKNFGTVYRWFNTDSDELLHIDVLAIIKEKTGLQEHEILVTEPALN